MLVIYATLTGTSPVGSNDSVALSSSLKLELQQAEKDITIARADLSPSVSLSFQSIITKSADCYFCLNEDIHF